MKRLATASLVLTCNDLYGMESHLRRPLALAVAPLAALALAAPASAQEATPTPSPQQTPHADCYPAVLNEDGSFASMQKPLPVAPAWGMDGEGGRTIRVKAAEPGTEVIATGYVRPNTKARELGRAVVDKNQVATFRFSFQGNARVEFRGGGCPFGAEWVAPTKARLGGLLARRNDVRDYSFSTFYAGPAGKVGNLYRVTSDGREVLTSRTRMVPEFVTINRKFLGSGRFGFVLRTGNDINSAGASTNVRDTVIH